MEKLTITNEMVENIKRKGAVMGNIALNAAMKQMADKSGVQLAVGVGLVQGLKYRGNLKRGIKAGLVTYGMMAGINAVVNVADKWDIIQKS